MKTWFTADTHFGHVNIISYTNRPFKDVHSMNKALIENWNDRVDKNDIVIFLGDFCFKEKPEKYLEKLNGHIVFVRGNHDHNNSLNTRIEYLVLEADNREIYCVHNPEDYSTAYSINLVGHVHDNWKVKRLYKTIMVNVGVDVWEYYPADINEISKAIEEFKKTDTKYPKR